MGPGSTQLTPSPQVPLLQVSGPLLVVQLLETPLLCLVGYARWGRPAGGAAEPERGLAGGRPLRVWAWLRAPEPELRGWDAGSGRGCRTQVAS